MYRIIILIRTPSVFSCTCTFFNVGEVSMQKVKVHRYVSGKRPEYAPESSTEEESEEEDFVEKRVTLATQAASGAVAVSYTHLDVYKRQHYQNACPKHKTNSIYPVYIN